MKIKRHLPCAPFPPSKPKRNDHYYVNHAGELVYNGRSPLDTVASIGQAVTEQSNNIKETKRYDNIRILFCVFISFYTFLLCLYIITAMMSASINGAAMIGATMVLSICSASAVTRISFACSFSTL